MTATTVAPATRLDRMLRASTVVWLSTVRPDGAPHLVPIWYSWDGERVWIASKPQAVKVRNLRADPRVMLALGEPDDDFDVGLVEGLAELPAGAARDVLPADHLARFRDQIAAIGLDEDEYWATYSQAIVVTPSRFLPWHGRTTPATARAGDGGEAGLVGRLLERLRDAVRERAWLPQPVSSFLRPA